MNLNATTSTSQDVSSPSVHVRKAGFQVTINARALGILLCARIVLCLTTWNLARPEKTDVQRTEAITSVSDTQAERATMFAKATQDYWNSIIELDNKSFDQTVTLVSELQKRMETDSQAHVLNYLATAFKDLFETYLNAVTRLPMKDVDEALLRHIREELKYGHEGASALAGMAETANALQAWSQRTKSTEGFVSDCLDSFIQGMMGRPFAGYEKAKRESESFDAEGKQIANGYWQQYQRLMESIKHTEEMRIKELELRASLAGKYGVEFTPRPDPEIQTSK
jgi:hypothetical protein